MLREISLFGALAPALLIYFLASIPTYFVFDKLLSRAGLYRWLWHPPVARLGLFLCLFYGIVQLPWF